MKIRGVSWRQQFMEKINDTHFSTALKIMICAVLSFGLFYHKFGESVAFGMTLGASLCSAVDTSSNLRNKVFDIGVVIIIVPIFSVLLTVAYFHTIPFYFLFAFFIFCSAIISVYGARATQMSFSLMLGICLSFTHITSTSDALSNSLYMFLGGALYTIVSVLFYLLRPTKIVNIVLSEYMQNIAQYLELRSEIWEEGSDKNSIRRQQLITQVKINDSFQKVTQYLNFRNTKLVHSESNRKLLLSVSFLNELHENAMSTTFNDGHNKKVFSSNKNLNKSIREITELFSIIISKLSKCIKLNVRYVPTNELMNKFEIIQNEIQNISDLNIESKLFLNSVLDYLNKQIKVIEALEIAMTEKEVMLESSINYQKFEDYIKPNTFSFKTLIENLNFNSIYFKYSLRITSALLIGLAFGDFIALQKEYWVLLTIVVIMRPGYGLTKTRVFQRVGGTIIGGIVGVLILYFVKDTLILGVLTAIAILLGYWYTSTNYKIGVIFITLYIVLIYGVLKNSVDISVFYRVVDTLTGAGIALMATSYLWPAWEFKSIRQTLITTFSATISYINEFKVIYFQDKKTSFNTQKTRQKAVIAIGNAMASYQRLIQDPKGKQIHSDALYELTILNQTLVGAVASLGSFLQSRKKLEFSFFFVRMVNTIIYNLDSSLYLFGQHNIVLGRYETCSQLEVSNEQLKLQHEMEELHESTKDDRVSNVECQMVLKQLAWMIVLSEKVRSLAKEFKES